MFFGNKIINFKNNSKNSEKIIYNKNKGDNLWSIFLNYKWLKKRREEYIMKILIRYLLILAAFIFTPFFWIGFNLAGIRITLKEFYVDLINYKNSKESFGIFDI